MKYKEFLDYIYQRHSGNVKLGLDRMQNILKAMDLPNTKLQGIHIAGTNGKGSTAAMCEALSLECGLTTGLNTSPHLIDYRERIRINGKNITFDQLISTYNHWKNILEINEASFFEITTAMAFAQFYEQQVDNAIFEVGLGGRLDGTNPFQSTVTVITSISFDHTKSLGSTIEKIAFEKAGILKKNTPLILGNVSKKAASVILDKAESLHCPVHIFNEDFGIKNVHVDSNGTTFDYWNSDLQLNHINISLLGTHQAHNASVAITAVITYLKAIGSSLNIDKMRNGLMKINWPGRLQILDKSPLTIIDGAHNEEGINSLVDNLKILFPKKKIFFVLAILRDKNLEKIIAKICSISSKIYISKNHSTRAAELNEQEVLVQKHNVDYEIVPDVVDATLKARNDASNNDIVIVTGSLYTISEVLKKRAEIF